MRRVARRERESTREKDREGGTVVWGFLVITKKNERTIKSEKVLQNTNLSLSYI